jgi:hypothetical protein
VSRLRVEQRGNDLHPSRECGYEVGTLGSDEHGKQYSLSVSALERLCYFIDIWYTEISIRSSIFSVLFGDTFEVARLEICINCGAGGEPHPATFSGFQATLFHIAVNRFF